VLLLGLALGPLSSETRPWCGDAASLPHGPLPRPPARSLLRGPRSPATAVPAVEVSRSKRRDRPSPQGVHQRGISGGFLEAFGSQAWGHNGEDYGADVAQVAAEHESPRLTTAVEMVIVGLIV